MGRFYPGQLVIYKDEQSVYNGELFTILNEDDNCITLNLVNNTTSNTSEYDQQYYLSKKSCERLIPIEVNTDSQEIPALFGGI